MTRKARVAGQFYPKDKKELTRQIEEFFTNSFLDDKRKKEKNTELKAIICPHAGYMFSGAAQAASYKEINNLSTDTYIIIGLSHNGNNTCVSIEDWETPLGIVKNDIEFQKKIIKQGIKINEETHKYEHSIEVQIPFLQYINKKKTIKIAPIIVSRDIDHKKSAEIIFNAIKDTKKNIMIIASSDFTHYGKNYEYFPFKEDIKKNMYKLDNLAIRFIEELDSAGFINYIINTKATICGAIPIIVTIELCKLLNANKGTLLKYYTSGDIVGDYSSAVGYAAIKIE